MCSTGLLTAFENLLLGARLSEYHTGLRAYCRNVLETLPLAEDSDDFVFDNQVLAQAMYFGLRIGEISCPTRYFPEASSIGFARSVRYGRKRGRDRYCLPAAALAARQVCDLRPHGRES